jgi:hypothetical protein
MSGSSTPSPPRMVEVTSSWRLEPAACEKSVGLCSRSAAHAVREDQQAACPRTMLGSLSASEARRNPPCRVNLPRRSEERAAPSRHLFNDSDRSDSNSLQMRLSRVRSIGSASLPSAPQQADPGVVPRRLQSLIIRRLPSSPAGAKDRPLPRRRSGG